MVGLDEALGVKESLHLLAPACVLLALIGLALSQLLLALLRGLVGVEGHHGLVIGGKLVKHGYEVVADVLTLS